MRVMYYIPAIKLSFIQSPREPFEAEERLNNI
jgi:hypothetical protein